MHTYIQCSLNFKRVLVAIASIRVRDDDDDADADTDDDEACVAAVSGSWKRNTAREGSVCQVNTSLFCCRCCCFVSCFAREEDKKMSARPCVCVCV